MEARLQFYLRGVDVCVDWRFLLRTCIYGSFEVEEMRNEIFIWLGRYYVPLIPF